MTDGNNSKACELDDSERVCVIIPVFTACLTLSEALFAYPISFDRNN